MPIQRGADGRLHVRGTVRLEEVGDAVGRSIDHPKVTSVSGLVLALLGRPAAPGDVVTHNGVRIEVSTVTGRGVQEAVVTPPPDSPPDRIPPQSAG